MILLLDTSTSVCRLGVMTTSEPTWHEWEANRELAKGLLKYITDILAEYNGSLSDVTGIGAFKGPGSFTGLRIGLTVANTLADGLNVPIVGQSGDTWSTVAVSELQEGKNHRIVMPDYGADAHITKPRK